MLETKNNQAFNYKCLLLAIVVSSVSNKKNKD